VPTLVFITAGIAIAALVFLVPAGSLARLADPEKMPRRSLLLRLLLWQIGWFLFSLMAFWLSLLSYSRSAGQDPFGDLQIAAVFILVIWPVGALILLVAAFARRR
jgi:hypothetical protein